jgi:phenylacetate-CoA ligase
VRYRTRDITSLDYATCACGRTTVRMRKTMGRSDDMLIIKGVNVYPSQIEDVLVAVEGCRPHYQLVVDKKGALDSLEVRIEVTEHIFFDEMKKQKEFLEKVTRRIESVLGVGVQVKLVEPNSIPRNEGKATRVIDKRKI